MAVHRSGARLAALVASLCAALVAGLLGGAGCAAGPQPVTVVGWNIESVGAPDSAEFAAALAILRAIDADVVALAEVGSAADARHLLSLAAALEMPHVVQADGAPFGSMRNAVLSRLPFAEARVLDAATLSGDPAANDLSRLVVVAVVEVPGAAPLTVIPVHFKSGGANGDQFRRAIEAARTVQALDGLDPRRAAYVVVGDFNDQIDEVPHQPPVFRDPPDGLPGAFRVGADLDARLVAAGLPNDPFAPLLDPAGPAMALLDAVGPTGDRATRPSSGRRLDYALVSPALAPDAAASLPATEVADAADHLPLVVDLWVPPACVYDADCDDGAWCNGAEVCDVGRCVRRPSPCAGACDEGRDRCG